VFGEDQQVVYSQCLRMIEQHQEPVLAYLQVRAKEAVMRWRYAGADFGREYGMQWKSLCKVG
jgi:hypothetical protein